MLSCWCAVWWREGGHDDLVRTETFGGGAQDGFSWAGAIRWGGWSLVGAACLLVAFVVGVVVSGLELPVPAAEALESPGTPTALFVLAAIGELLLAPGAIALFFALRDVDRVRMTFAVMFFLMATPMFLASRGPILSLSQLSDEYRGAAESGRAAYLTTGEFAIELQNTYSTMALILLSLGSIVAGTVMLSSHAFGGWIAYVTIAAGVLSIFTPFLVIGGLPEGLGFFGLALGALWQFVVGLRMARLRV